MSGHKLSDVIDLLKNTIVNKKALEEDFQKKIALSSNGIERLSFGVSLTYLQENLVELETILHDLENVTSLD